MCYFRHSLDHSKSLAAASFSLTQTQHLKFKTIQTNQTTLRHGSFQRMASSQTQQSQVSQKSREELDQGWNHNAKRPVLCHRRWKQPELHACHIAAT